MTYQTFNLGDFVIVTSELVSQQYLMLCLLTNPYKSKVVSSEENKHFCFEHRYQSFFILS